MIRIMREKLKFQHTLINEIKISGKGLHTGKNAAITIRPAPVNYGISFYRTDLDVFIPASPLFISELNFSTNLQSGSVYVKTVEHLMAALCILNVDNAIIEIDNEEVPILDGSSRKYISMLLAAGIKRQNAIREYITLNREFEISDGEKYIRYTPGNALEIEYTIDFDHRLLKSKNMKIAFSTFDFINNIGPSRTFCFLRDIKHLKAKGFIKGGNLTNALVFGEKIILNDPRLPDEPLKHKILDFIGDLYLLTRPILGKFTIYKGGHKLHSLMTKKIYREFTDKNNLHFIENESIVQREYSFI